MSFNRENVLWQSPEDGKWRLGFYAFTTHHSDDEDYDPEWVVDYDFDRFWWTSKAHTTESGAWGEWTGPNPGGTTIVPATDDEAAHLDHMWKMHRDADYAEKWTIKTHDDFIAAKQKAVADAGTLDKLYDGTEVHINVVNKLNPAQEVMGYRGRLQTEGDWLVLPVGPGSTIKVYDETTGKLYRHGWDATTTVTLIQRPTWRRR